MNAETLKADVEVTALPIISRVGVRPAAGPIGPGLVKFALTTESFDTGNEFDPVVQYRYTATRPGYYLCHGKIRWRNIAANLRWDVLLLMNGAEVARGQYSSGNALGLPTCSTRVWSVIPLAIGDYIEVWTNPGVAADYYTGQDQSGIFIVGPL